MSSWFLLAIAIVSEVFATASLKASDGFTKLMPTLGVVLGYGVAFVMLATAVKNIPLGTAYAVWSGVGTVGALLVGIFVFQEKTGLTQMLGVALILIGTVILKLDNPA